jgi:hypothetical protein
MKSMVSVDSGVPAYLSARQSAGSLAAARAGVQGQYAEIRYKGKTWSLKYQGDNEPIPDQQGQLARQLDVVIVGVADRLSKRYYAGAFQDRGENLAPDCWSIDGITPDQSASDRQSATCALCPQNVWGSGGTGSRAKACQDRRRLVVVPLGDIMNVKSGGPMLLDIPPATLTNLTRYSRDLERKGVPDLWYVGTRLSFNPQVSHPLIEFTVLGYVTEEQDAQIAELQQDPLIDQILYDAGPIAEGPAQAADTTPIPGSPPARAQRQLQAPPQPQAPAAIVTPLRRAAPPTTRSTGSTGTTRTTPQPAPAAAPPELESAIDDLLDGPA